MALRQGFIPVWKTDSITKDNPENISTFLTKRILSLFSRNSVEEYFLAFESENI